MIEYPTDGDSKEHDLMAERDPKGPEFPFNTDPEALARSVTVEELLSMTASQLRLATITANALLSLTHDKKGDAYTQLGEALSVMQEIQEFAMSLAVKREPANGGR